MRPHPPPPLTIQKHGQNGRQAFFPAKPRHHVLLGGWVERGDVFVVFFTADGGGEGRSDLFHVLAECFGGDPFVQLRQTGVGGGQHVFVGVEEPVHQGNGDAADVVFKVHG